MVPERQAPGDTTITLSTLYLENLILGRWRESNTPESWSRVLVALVVEMKARGDTPVNNLFSIDFHVKFVGKLKASIAHETERDVLTPLSP